MDFIDLTVVLVSCVYVGGLIVTIVREQFNG